jgi:hypothetical protein
MRQRSRKLIGVPVILVLLLVWSVLATTLFEAVAATAPQWLVLVYFALAGLSLFVPAALAISWMLKPDRTKSGASMDEGS